MKTPTTSTRLSQEEKRSEIARLLPEVERIVRRVLAPLPPHIQSSFYDDMRNSGVLGLIDAVERFDPSLGVELVVFAGRRIRGAVIDEMRNADWLPRSAREMKKKIDRASASLETPLGRHPTEQEVADKLEISLESLQEMKNLLRNGPVTFSSHTVEGGLEEDEVFSALELTNPDEQLASLTRRELLEILTEEITNLPEREKQAVALLYYEEMHQKEIAEILGVTEPRISQILAQAHNRLNSRILERLRIPVSPLKGGPNG